MKPSALCRYRLTGRTITTNREYFGDVYTAKFLASFAQVAQEQRHRTLRVKFISAGTMQKNMVFTYRKFFGEHR